MFGCDFNKSIFSDKGFQSYSFSWKKDLLNFFFESPQSDVLTLLCYFVQLKQMVQGLIRTLARTNFKMTQWCVIFKIIAAVVYKTRILWPWKCENTLHKQPPKGVPQVFIWQLLSKSFKNVCKGVKFSITLKWTPFQYS